MDPQPDRPESNNSSDLSGSDSDIITIFPYYNISIRRALVFEFPYRYKIKLICKRHFSNDGSWICEYETQIREGEIREEFSATRPDAYEKMKELIKTADVIESLTIDLETGSTISLVDGNTLVNVVNLYLCFRNELDEETNQSYKRILRQANPDKLEVMYLHVEHLSNDQKVLIRDHFLELEKTSFECLRNFHFAGHLNDQQLLAMRTPVISISDSTAITPAGFIHLVKKVVLQTTPTETLVLFKVSNEVQIYFFRRILWDEGDEPFLLSFNSVHPGWRVLLHFLKDDDDGIANKPLRIEIMFIDEEFFDEYVNNEEIDNSGVIGKFPSSVDFLSDVAEGLPENFALLRE